ncbi:MAG: M20 family peptidase [Myxococcales bacterium]|nr:M20 family peptidase [Myxococcales bacterium]
MDPGQLRARRTLKRMGQGMVGIALLLLLAVLVNTLRKGSRQLDVKPAPKAAVDARAAATRLAAAIRARTIASPSDPRANADQFRALHEHLQRAYPKVHATLSREVIGGTSLLYTWRGSAAKGGAKPIALMAHQDVVPVAAGTRARWSAPPFGGVIKDGFVWGRGAWDNKCNLIAQLEAVEALLAKGFTPRRTIYFVFGADEEIGGLRGAAAIGKLLASRGVRLAWVLDEGLLITSGVLAGLDKPAALIGIAEKGYLSLVLRVEGKPGHSSMPPVEGSAIARLTAALARLARHPMPAKLGGVMKLTLETVAPEMAFGNRLVLSNLWMFSPLVRSMMTAKSSTNAALRTTTAMTVLRAGNKDNVVPGVAEATVNFRLLPGDTKDAVVAHVRRVVADASVKIRALPFASEPSKVSSPTSAPYKLVERTVRELFADVIVAPGLTVGATDSRHLSAIAESVLRFSPVRAKREDLPRFHGTDERISVQNLGELIQFYRRLIEQGAK